MKVYKNKRWKNKRAYILKRDLYLCQECVRYGRSTSATTVHHIKPYKEYADLFLCDRNLISLCNKCHEHMHDRLTNKLTEKGNRLLKRVWNKSSPPG